MTAPPRSTAADLQRQIESLYTQRMNRHFLVLLAAHVPLFGALAAVFGTSVPTALFFGCLICSGPGALYGDDRLYDELGSTSGVTVVASIRDRHLSPRLTRVGNYPIPPGAVSGPCSH